MPYAIAGPSSPAIPSLDGINRATDRISSGLRTDQSFNAAETAISGRLDASVGESTIQIRNSLQQLSALQKADQTLGQGKDIVERIQELTVQSGNSVLSEADQTALTDEVSSLVTGLEDLLDNAQFAGNDLFTVNTTETMGVLVRLDDLKEDLTERSILDLNDLDQLSSQLSGLQADLGAKQNGIERDVDQVMQASFSSSQANSRIADTDVAIEVAHLIQEQLRFEASVAAFDHQRLAEQSIINLLS